MILYPYVHDGIISHGRAAEILGIFKMDLIVLYGELGLLEKLYYFCPGILMLAYDKGHIGQTEVKACLDAMIASHIRLDKKSVML